MKPPHPPYLPTASPMMVHAAAAGVPLAPAAAMERVATIWAQAEVATTCRCSIHDRRVMLPLQTKRQKDLRGTEKAIRAAAAKNRGASRGGARKQNKSNKKGGGGPVHVDVAALEVS